jgi:S1-C subfamily serine protease
MLQERDTKKRSVIHGREARRREAALDVIQLVNGPKLTTPRELALGIASIKPGETAQLTVLHDGHSKDIMPTGKQNDETLALTDEQIAFMNPRGSAGTRYLRSAPEGAWDWADRL